MEEVTRILNAIVRDEKQASAELLPEVYKELRQLARHKLAKERPGQTLQPTALVHEAWLRIVKTGDPGWDGRAHFFGAAAEAMRRILVDRARRKQAERHGGGRERVDLADANVAADEENSDTLLTVNELLERVEAQDKIAAELIKLRFFAGLSNKEAAQALGLSEGVAKRTWAHVRAWLKRELENGAQTQ